MTQVVAQQQRHAHPVGKWRRQFGRRRRRSADRCAQVTQFERPPQALHGQADRRNDRPFAHNGEIEPRSEQRRLRVGMMVIVDDVDAADESQPVVDQRQFAVETTQQAPIGPPPARGTEDDDLRADRSQPRLQDGRVCASSKAVDRQSHLHAAVGSRRQRIAEPQSDVVLREDVGFEVDRSFRAVDRCQQQREIVFAVLQQPQAVAAIDQGPGRDFEAPAARPTLARSHTTSRSAISGMWSDRCDHSMPLGTRTSWTVKPRT